MPQLLLIVEDDDDIRQTCADVLRDEGFEVVEACHGLAGLEALRGGLRPDVILLDYSMPIMNGGAFRREQRADPRFGHCPVILMTAHNDAKALAAEIEPAHMLRKPMSLDDLITTVKSVLTAAQAPPTSADPASSTTL